MTFTQAVAQLLKGKTCELVTYPLGEEEHYFIFLHEGIVQCVRNPPGYNDKFELDNGSWLHYEIILSNDWRVSEYTITPQERMFLSYSIEKSE